MASGGMTISFTRDTCPLKPMRGAELDAFLDDVNNELKKGQGGGSYKQRGGVSDRCKRGAPFRNSIRVAVLAALTGATVMGVRAAGSQIAGVLTGETACEISITGSAMSLSLCSQYAEFLIWLNGEVLAGRLPFWEYVKHGFTLTGITVGVTTASSAGMWLVDKIIDIICETPGFIWETPEQTTPPPGHIPTSAVTAAAAAAVGAVIAEVRVAPAAVGGPGGAAAPGSAPHAGGYRRRHKKTRRHRKSHGRRRKTKSA